MPITQPISRNNRKPFDKYGHNASRLYRSFIARNLIPSYLFMCDIDQIKFQRELFFLDSLRADTSSFNLSKWNAQNKFMRVFISIQGRFIFRFS